MFYADIVYGKYIFLSQGNNLTHLMVNRISYFPG